MGFLVRRGPGQSAEVARFTQMARIVDDNDLVIQVKSLIDQAALQYAIDGARAVTWLYDELHKIGGGDPNKVRIIAEGPWTTYVDYRRATDRSVNQHFINSVNRMLGLSGGA